MNQDLILLIEPKEKETPKVWVEKSKKFKNNVTGTESYAAMISFLPEDSLLQPTSKPTLKEINFIIDVSGKKKSK